MVNLGSAKFWQPPKDSETRKLSESNVIFGYAFDYEAVEFSNHLVSVPVKSHFLTIAQNRAGKGTSLIIPNLLNYSGSVVVIDPKGELTWMTHAMRSEVKGQKVFVLDPWDEVQRQYTNNADLIGLSKEWPRPSRTTFNPLSLLDPTNDNYAEDLAYIADSLIINQSSTQPFFDDSARELVAGLIAYLVETAPAEEINFATVRGLIALPLSQLKSVAIEAQKLPPRSIARRKLGMFADDGGSDKELASILSTAKQQTAILDSAALCRSMEGGEDIFAALLNDRGASIYLVLPVDKLQTYGRWLRIMISFAIRAVSRHPGKLKNQVIMFLDEFGTIGKLSAVAQAFGLMAGRNLSIWAFLQDLNQLKKHYKDDWETFLANSQAVAVFGVNDQTTATYFSKMLGNQTVERISVKTAKMRKEDPNFSAMADQSFVRPLLTPDELIKITAEGGGLLFGAEKEPLLYERIKYWEWPVFQRVTPPNPLIPADVDRWKKAGEKAEEVKKAKKVEERKKQDRAEFFDKIKGKIRGFCRGLFEPKPQPAPPVLPIVQKAPQPAPPKVQEQRPAIVEKRQNSTTKAGPRVGRNDPCPCGSGEKFKKCCGKELG